jgi:ketosteroid isomerase-like protein
MLGLLGILLFLGEQATDEERIRGIVYECVDAAESHDLREITGYMSEDFYAEDLNFDRRKTIDMMRYVFLTFKQIRVNLRGLEVAKTGDESAETIFIANITAARQPGGSGRELTEHRGSDRFRLTFRKDDGDWLITGSELVRSTAD